MQLNYEGRQKLRKEVEKKLALVPEGERIKLPKETLEQLLFELDTIIFDDEEEEMTVKYLVWSGEFLRKVDLSEVSFDNVTWSACRSEGFGNHMSTHKGYQQYGVDKINLSRTNAKIDLKKSFEAIVVNIIDFTGCDFSGVNLSNNILDTNCFETFSIHKCNFDDTKIKFCNDIEKDRNPYPDQLYLTNSSFKNVDFSSFTIMADCIEQGGDYDISDCDFYNSGLRIEIDSKKFGESLKFSQKYKEFLRKHKINPYKDDLPEKIDEIKVNIADKEKRIEFYDETSEMRRMWLDYVDEIYQFNQQLSKGHLYGCYVNGKRIPTPEEREAKKSQLLSEYQMFEDETISSVLGEVNTAIKATRKR